MGDVITLGEIAERARMVEVACAVCGRRGRLRRSCRRSHPRSARSRPHDEPWRTMFHATQLCYRRFWVLILITPKTAVRSAAVSLLQPLVFAPAERHYHAASLRTLLTICGTHLPPLGVRTPRAVSSAQIARKLRPLPRRSLIVGRTDATKVAALSLRA